MGLIEVSVFIIAVAFCILVFFLIKVLNSVNQSIAQTEKAIASLQNQMDDLGKETTQLLHQANDVISDLEQKSKSLNPLFQTVHDAGQAAHQLSNSLLQASSTLSKNLKKGADLAAEQNAEKVSVFLRAASLGYFLVQKWKQRRHKENGERQQANGEPHKEQQNEESKEQTEQQLKTVRMRDQG
jgi:uncharacterized protein YoxC